MENKRVWRVLALVLSLVLLMGIGCETFASAKKPRVLVVYFSKTNNTKKAAKLIKKSVPKYNKSAKVKLYRIVEKDTYTKADMAYNVDNTRTEIEQNSDSVRPEIKSGKIKGIRKYDLIFVGYPIWHGEEPRIINTFLEKYNLKGRRVVPFCTSGGSGISGSISGFKKSCRKAKVGKGRELTDASAKTIRKWTAKMMKWARIKKK